MSKIFQPSNQIKLTNVAVVRLKKGGKRFEIACYKNKVSEWRNNVETDLDEVLQIHSVFTNVSKGQVAKLADWTAAFKTTDLDQVIRDILKNGQVQVNEKEREVQLDSLHRDIITIIAEKCVNPNTKRPYTVSMIEKAVQELPHSWTLTKSAKQQALETIRLLTEKNIIPIARAQMRLRIVLGGKEAKKTKEKLAPCFAAIEEEQFDGDELELICLIDPGQFRIISELVVEKKGRMETLSLRESEV